MIRNCNNETINIEINKSKILDIKNKIDNIENINPPVKIINVTINNKNIHVIQDGYLFAGTKQRVAEIFAEKAIAEEKKITGNQIKTIIYTGTWNGFGAVATAFAAYRLGLQSNVYLSSVASGKTEASSIEYMLEKKQLNTLLALNANIYICDTYRAAKMLSYEGPNGMDNNKDQFAIPMGLNDEKSLMTKILAKQIKIAIKGSLIEKTENPRIWMVAGSGGILESVNRAINNCKIFVYLTGGGKYIRRVKKYIKKNRNIVIINEHVKLDYSDNEYYNTVKRYDDMILSYIEQYGKEGDFIWNVASE